jgi:type III pantothenate kinase
MILCLDVGNSHIFGGLYEDDELRLSFRKTSGPGASSDEFGLFFRAVLRENGFDPDGVRHVAMCSVVPELVYSISASCRKYFGGPPFVLRAGVRTGLRIAYRNPAEVGADRIANAIAAVRMHPGSNLLIIDLGTATTVDAVSAEREYLGGVIIPGLKMSMTALDRGTARLGTVEIMRPDAVLGRSTAESIQSGLFHGHLGALREISRGIADERFGGGPVRIVATGGFSGLFQNAGLFDDVAPDLPLRGLCAALELSLA